MPYSIFTIILFLVLLLYHAFSYYDTQNSIVIASVRTQSRKRYLSSITQCVDRAICRQGRVTIDCEVSYSGQKVIHATL
jgi:aromatic ring-cleaving dioxygenase